MSSVVQLRQQAWKIRNARDEKVRAQAKRVRSLIQERSHLNNQQLKTKILYSSATELVTMLNDRKTTSVDILLLLAERAYTIGLDNCLITEDNFDDALKTAEESDRHRHQTGLRNWTFETPEGQECLPCLFGIPLSVKDTIHMKGFSSTAGSTAKYKQKEAEDGLFIDVLRKGGLIPFIRTNIPQMVMIYESHNYMFGRACNPWDKHRTTGGSSGGEGGLIACRGSVVGVGCDIGGSIRIPSEFCGVYGLKPSSHRLSFKGHMKLASSFNGQINIPAVMGPLGSSPNDLALMMKVLTEKSSHENNPKRDAYTQNFPFDIQLYQSISQAKGLRIGYFESMGLIETTPASKRAVHEVLDVIRALGHEPVRIQIPNEKQIIGIFMSIISAEGGMQSYKEFLQGEPLIEEYGLTQNMTRLPKCLMQCLGWIVEKFKPRMGYLMRRSNKKTAYEYLRESFSQRKQQQQWISYWKNNELDLVVTPGFGSQSQLHGFGKFCFVSAAYTFIWNVLEMAVGALPVTVVRENEQTYDTVHNDFVSTRLIGNASKSAGLPVGVQIVGLPYQEEKILGLMKAIDERIGFSKKHRLPL